jgi:hypothetical protein
MSAFPQYNVNNQHQLIRRQNTYSLDKQLVTIHSEDRDIKKWPNSNYFEIDLPEALINVQSVRLAEIGLPNNQYIFSNNQQNTKLAFLINPKVSNRPVEYLALAQNVDTPYTITIQEGTYTPDEMANELQNNMNLVVTDYLKSKSVPTVPYDRFVVIYDSVGQRFMFGNTYDEFTFEFNKKIIYDVSCNMTQIDRYFDVWQQYTNWGLPSFLGFNKKNYNSTQTTASLYINYTKPPTEWLKPDSSLAPAPNQKIFAYSLTAPLISSIDGDNVIYMEMDKFNSMDELNPYSDKTNNMYNNDYNGVVNAAFAKIPITSSPGKYVFDSRTNFLQNISSYFPPIDKVRKLKFKFRYHDERLVEFKDNNFNFTLAFYLLKDEIARDADIRVPPELLVL